jgi:methionyl-tRNA formyltransferase
MDAGDIITQREVEITDVETASTLHDKLKIVGRDLLLDTLPMILDHTAPRIKQDEKETTFALTIRREEEKLDFSKTKREIYNQIRGLNSWPGAYFMFDNMIVKVWESSISNNYFPDLFNGQVTAIYEEGIGVKVYNGEIILKVIQPEGKRRMTSKEFVNGYKEELIGRLFL